MNRLLPTSAQRSDRRESPRHYLAQPPHAELIYGRRRMAFEQSRIGDISEHGIGVRATQPVRIAPGTSITNATAQDDRVWTVTGEVASVSDGIHIGVKVSAAERAALLAFLGRNPDSVTISPPQDCRSQVAGKLSLSARHPLQWAVKAGAVRLNLAAVTAIDSSGIGLLLVLNERSAVCVDMCAPQICRFLKLCGTPTLCAPDCQRAEA